MEAFLKLGRRFRPQEPVPDGHPARAPSPETVVALETSISSVAGSGGGTPWSIARTVAGASATLFPASSHHKAEPATPPQWLPSPNTMTPPVHLGLDIAKLTLDLSPHPVLKHARYDNTRSGHRQLLRDLAKIPGVHVVCEATGGYEHLLLQALHQAGIPVSRLNPRLIRDYARARGHLAKTDAIDAAVLADYGRRLQPAADPVPDPAHQRLAELVSRRRELQDLLQRERHRHEHHRDPFIAKAAQRLHTRLEKDLQKLDAEITRHQAASPELDRKVRRLTLVQGFGDTTARTLLAVLPELGTLKRGQAAALAGVAPYNHDSGPRRGQRHIAHGRPAARAALYMAALVATRFNPVLQPFYQRLRTHGKPPKSALAALMRKLVELANSLLKNPSFSPTS
jgi:transposase